jgi:hypothetical protein
MAVMAVEDGYPREGRMREYTSPVLARTENAEDIKLIKKNEKQARITKFRGVIAEREVGSKFRIELTRRVR